GLRNVASGFGSFAAGVGAHAISNFSFAWADNPGVSTPFEAVVPRSFIIRASGGVGIGTNEPLADLHVNGNICYTGSIGACSDKRYKKNISNLSGSLDKVLKMRGVSYDWNQVDYPKHDFDDQKHLGFIAQEVEELYPEMVMTDKNGYKSVDYSRLTPVLVEAIKEQQEQIKSQNAQIETQQAQLDKLQVLVNNLVSMTQSSMTLSKK
ncbi:MAG: tail fiber domain-containing protein, partial [candidate division Zixibacteria bacterium]|nr:tail fiber domain-containing protein [candidate division Zixibacteria bacterium]